MKTKNSLSLILLFAVLSLPFSGCKKAWDHISNGPGKELKMCNIKKLVSLNPNSEWGEMYFTYNQWGNPEKVIMKVENSTGRPNYFFQYDNKQRLITFINTYKKELVDGDEVAFERFQYNADGTINTGETLYGIYKAGQVLRSDLTSPADYYWSYHIDFDAKGRVSKVSDPYGRKSLYYNYDERGNVMYPKEDGIEYIDFNKNTYDNNVNFLRTNKVWMFLNRDYSMNNKYSTSGITCYGLPAGFTSDPDGTLKYLQNLFGTNQNQVDDYTQIEYECDCGLGSSK